MSYDLAMVLGLVLWFFTVPALVAAYADLRVPRLGLAMLTVGAGLVTWAFTRSPRGYTLEQVAEAFVKVVRALLE